MPPKWVTALEEMEEKCNDRSIKLSSNQRAFIMERINIIKDEFRDMEIKKSLQEIKQEFKKDLMTEIREELNILSDNLYEAVKLEEGVCKKKELTYSDVVKDLQEASRGKKEVVITTKDATKPEDSKKLKEMIKETINPGKEAIKIQNLRTAGRNKVIIETRTEEDKKKLVQGSLKSRLEEKGLKVESMKKKDPKVIIFSIDRTITEEDFKDNVWNQNFQEATISKDDFTKGFRYSFMKGKRDSKYSHRVFQVTPDIREHLVAKEKVYSGWESHFIKDFTGITRCYKCQGFGHTAQGCREKEDTCGHCARRGHSIQDCPNKNRREVCANCHRFGKQSDHSTTDINCPAYRFALERDILRTGYGKK
ncbi:hypothetical protein J437_LFUL013294 [Ladona fulva]|uniref:CCHC-type domain-containing protein n=1 Tax=Ladona fulva TaxID=123851 RepID=A0A8K0P5K2_LADFU|nr:hypothetical protein J437_LFUL013294 [Ladona fulva]